LSAGLAQPILVEVVDADFEAVVQEASAERQGESVGALGDEIERGPEPEGHFEFGELFDAGEAERAFDVVGEDEGEWFAVGPPGPAAGCATGGFEDGPRVAAPFPYASGPEATDGDAETPGEPRFGRVVEAVGEQGEMGDGSWEMGDSR